MSDFAVPRVELDTMSIEAAAIDRVPADAARRYQVVPVAVLSDSVLIVAMSDPTNLKAVDDLFFLSRLRIEPVLASAGAIKRALAKYYP